MKEILDQYYDLKKEINENRKRIEKLEARIDKLEKRISDIEEGETVIDGVRYIDRGYEHVEDKFNAMGADIVRIKGE